MIQFSLKSVHIWKSYSKKTKGSRFYGTRCRLAIADRAFTEHHSYCTTRPRLQYTTVAKVISTLSAKKASDIMSPMKLSDITKVKVIV